MVWDLLRARSRWRVDLGAQVTVRPVVTDDGVLVMATRGMLLYATDVARGRRFLWIHPLRATVLKVVGVPLPNGQGMAIAVVLLDSSPLIVNARTGKVLWRARQWHALDVAVHDQIVAWLDADGQIRTFILQPREETQPLSPDGTKQ